MHALQLERKLQRAGELPLDAARVGGEPLADEFVEEVDPIPLDGKAERRVELGHSKAPRRGRAREEAR